MSCISNGNSLTASVLLSIIVLLAWWVASESIHLDTYGATEVLMAGNVRIEFDNAVFNITDVSIKYDEIWGPIMIGLIENKDLYSTIEGVSLSVQMYDKNDHLIGVMKGYPQASYILPNQKTAFEIQSGDEDIRNIDHVIIEIFATDWGTAYGYEGQNISADHPYIGIIGIELTPHLSKQIGLNQTKGVLLTNITKGSPAEKFGLIGGSVTTITDVGEINVGGDVILKIDNTEISNMQDYISYINQKHIGDKISLTILRDNTTKILDLVLGERPNLNSTDSSLNNLPNSGDSNYSEELYDECVRVAGESFCDYLFRK